MQELAGGLFTWTGRHPDWNDDPHWGLEVRSCALRTDDGVILFDPIAVPDELNAQPAFPGERSLWIPGQNALVIGDSLPGGGAMPDAWLESEWAKGTRDQYNEKLRPLLDLPMEVLLPTHGDPVLDDARKALQSALG